jgi:predicted dehydrogenase
MMKKDGYRVLIVGCGDIGSRHLQAVASLPQVCEVEVVEPRPKGLQLGQERLAEIPDCQPSITFRWLSSLEEASKGGDLCIVATQADVRCQLVDQVVETLGYSSFILEKLVAQSVREYENLLAFSKAKRLSVWVNCKARAHASHKRVKAHLDPHEPIIFSTIGGNHGLVNNGVHAADLFVFYDGMDQIEGGGAYIDPILHTSKRGTGVFDLSGTLHGYTAKGSHLDISFAGYHGGPAHFSVVSPRYRAVIDDQMKCFYESTMETGWSWRQVPFEANLMISHMTRRFAADILRSGQCELPTLQECFPAHRFILSELQPHFNKLLNHQSDRCPAT